MEVCVRCERRSDSLLPCFRFLKIKIKKYFIQLQREITYRYFLLVYLLMRSSSSILLYTSSSLLQNHVDLVTVNIKITVYDFYGLINIH